MAKFQISKKSGELTFQRKLKGVIKANTKKHPAH
jgi:hypothetical protein